MSQMKKSKLSLGLLAGAGVSGLVGSISRMGNSLYDLTLLPMREHETPIAPFSSQKLLGSGAPPESPLHTLLDGRAWLEQHPFRKDIFLNSRDGLRLHAVTLTPSNHTNRWAVCIHGFWEDCNSMGLYARHYYEQGYQLLLPDLRGHGESEGSYVGMGFDDRLDIISWISVLLRRHPDAQVILHGVAIGAATVLMTTGGALPSAIRATVSDCSYTSATEELQWLYQHFGAGRFPKAPALAALRQVTKLRAGYDLKDASPIHAVSASKTPTLFLHGEQDSVVPTSMLPQLYSAAACPKDMRWIQGAEHAMSVAVDSKRYWSLVDSFLASYL
ncbi:MAG: alpha/beta hydrolase family protein [Oscillospiraceae bacterium]|nr:alpha/beta hydrolase family protein [Oscillospiraceae bacterium]